MMEIGNTKTKTKSTRLPGLAWLRFLFWFLLIIGLGFLIINQGLGFFYKAHFLKAPCDLCAELNPGVQECIDRLNEPRASYWEGGDWSYPFAEEQHIEIEIPNK